MRLVSRFMVAGAVALSGSVLGCDSGSTDSGSTDTGSTATNDTVGGNTDTGGGTDTPDGTVGPGDDVTASDDTVAEDKDTTEGEDVAIDDKDTGEGVDTAEPPDTTGGGDVSTSGNGACQDPKVFGAPKTHIVSIRLPTAAADFKCDSTNDGTIDAKDGTLNALLGNPLLAGQFNVNELLAQNITEGDIVLLADLNGTWAAGGGTGLFLNMFLGEKIDPTAAGACIDTTVTSTNAKGEPAATAWDGKTTCDFSIADSSFGADGCPVVQIPNAAVAGGKIDAGPVTFNFTLPLGGLTLDVEINKGRFFGDVTGEFGVASGHLCGEIPYDKLEAAFNKVCTDDPTQSLCSFKGIALPLIKNGCNDGGTNCSVIVDLESTPAGAFTVAAPK